MNDGMKSCGHDYARFTAVTVPWRNEGSTDHSLKGNRTGKVELNAVVRFYERMKGIRHWVIIITQDENENKSLYMLIMSTFLSDDI